MCHRCLIIAVSQWECAAFMTTMPDKYKISGMHFINCVLKSASSYGLGCHAECADLLAAHVILDSKQQ